MNAAKGIAQHQEFEKFLNSSGKTSFAPTANQGYGISSSKLRASGIALNVTS